MNKQVQDVYATLAASPYGDYVFAVVIRYTDGTKGQECTNKTLRDCLVYGNGVIAGLFAAGVDRIPCNVVFDPRFEKGVG